MVLDGQHRVYGFSLAKAEVRVPVIIFSGLSLKQEVALFIDINTKQKPVPSELLLDIKNLADAEDDLERDLREIFDTFKDNGDNVLSGLMSPAERSPTKISRTTFNAALKKIYGTLSRFNNEEIYRLVDSYLSSIKITLSERNISFESAIVRSNVFRGMIEVLPDFAQLVKIKHDRDFSVNNFYEFVYPVFSAMPANSFTAKNISQSDFTGKVSDAIRKSRSI